MSCLSLIFDPSGQLPLGAFCLSIWRTSMNNSQTITHADKGVKGARDDNLKLSEGALDIGKSRFLLIIDPVARTSTGTPVDLSALAFMLDDQGVCRSEHDFLFEGYVACPGLQHMGDDCQYSFAGEEISVDPRAIPAHVQKVVFAVTTESRHSPGPSMESLHCLHLSLLKGRSDSRPVAAYGACEMGAATVIQVAVLSRNSEGWVLECSLRGFQDGLADVCRGFGLDAQ